MGVDTHLYLNTRWGLDDILDVIERTQGEKPKIRSHHDFAPGYFSLDFKGHSLNVFTQSQLPTGTVTYLSFSSNPKGIKILRDIANTLGGILMESDSDGKCEVIEGNMWEEDGLAYFLKYAIVHDGIDPNDIKALADSKQKWHKRVCKGGDAYE